MRPVVCGAERELGFIAFQRGSRMSLRRSLSLLSDCVATLYRSLPDQSGQGVFLGNGGRYYTDCGHPEICSPEVLSADDYVTYSCAGERILLHCVEHLREAGTFESAFLSRGTQCYAQQVSFAAHENYALETPVDETETIRAIVPHLMSRPIYTGAGGFSGRGVGLKFHLSARHTFQNYTTACKDSGFLCKIGSRLSHHSSRLHIHSGEGLCSQTSCWLLVATTKLILTSLACGARLDPSLYVDRPVAGLSKFSEDPYLQATITTQSGRKISALELQSEYWHLVESRLDAPAMPDWAELAITRWREMLEQLREGPHAVEKRLDWAIKQKIFQQAAARRKIDWLQLPLWDTAIRRMSHLWETAHHGNPCDPATLRDLFARRSPFYSELKRYRHLFQQYGLDWGQFEEVEQLRKELIALDTRFGLLTSDGLFETLDQQGQLDHRLVDEQSIVRAMHVPPAGSQRAICRGTLVHQLAHCANRYVADWDRIEDTQLDRSVDMLDELVCDDSWHYQGDSLTRQLALEASRQDEDALLLDRIVRYYSHGQYESVNLRLNDRLLSGHAEGQMRLQYRLKAWAQTRLGLIDAAQWLNPLRQSSRIRLWLVNDYLHSSRFGRLTPDRVLMSCWLELGQQLVVQNGSLPPEQVALLSEHYVAYQLASQNWTGALASLEASSHQPLTDSRLHGRFLALMGKAYHELGEIAWAAEKFREARQHQLQCGALGDLNEFTLPWLALLNDDVELAGEQLQAYATRNLRSGNRVGEARCLVLLARKAPSTHLDSAIRERLATILEATPLLGHCRLMRQIIDRWDAWIGGQAGLENFQGTHWGV
jgi:hypothetical protein